MSFAADVKNELCKAEHSRKQLELLSKGAAFAMTEDGDGCFFNTENKKAARCIADAFDCVGKENAVSESSFRGRTLYTVSLADKSYAHPVPDCSDDEAFGVYLRGVFLVCGLVANPEKGYQLELFLHDEEKCRLLLSMIEEHGMGAKLSSRRGSSFLYIKESEKISDMLTFMGAMMQAMEIMNVKIYKEVRNNVNRSVNCEAANLDKTIAAAQKQAEDIRYIFEHKGESYLPDELLQVAKIRLKALELSLSDIGKMLEPPISRSGVNHRLKKISLIADTLRGKEKTGD